MITSCHIGLDIVLGAGAGAVAGAVLYGGLWMTLVRILQLGNRSPRRLRMDLLVSLGVRFALVGGLLVGGLTVVAGCPGPGRILGFLGGLLGVRHLAVRRFGPSPWVGIEVPR